MLWDASQLPAFRQCASDFQKLNPGITVKITQYGWGDYWTALSTGFISGTAPDVFTNHLSKFPEIAKYGQLVDLAPFIARDKIDLALYPAGLVRVWGRAGQQYGLPKDWDTVAFVVNLAHASKAGVTLVELQDLTWNPRDGGSFGQVIKRLTLDISGNNALHPKFDRKNVAVYGYQNPGTAGMTGQTSWGFLAVSNGFRYQDMPWAGRFHYDSPRLAETLDWLASLPGQGVSAPYEDARSLGADAMFIGGRAAMIPQGSWMVSYFTANARFPTAWVPLPKGPIGARASMMNGLADSIWVGSKVKESAWKWVRYLASAECQSVVARRGVVFPSMQGMAERVIDLQRQQGVDASAFVTMARSHVYLSPIDDNGSENEETLHGAIEAVLLGKSRAAPALQAANQLVNQRFRSTGLAPGRN